jgi:hypothetical protein
MIVVVAAGNYGVTVEGKTVYGSIATPGNDPHVITVGAVDTKDTAIRSDDTVARFSSRGPTRFDMVLKPDLAAPGTRVTSAEAAGSYLARTYPQRHVAGDGANAYIQLSGTSMAAGVVTGTVALLLEDKPRLPLREAKFVLQLTSSLMLSEGLVATGAGSINALGARTYLVRSPSAHTFSKTRIGPETISAGGIAFFGRITPTDFLNAVSGDSFVGSTRGRLPAQNNSRGPLVGLEIPRNADSGIPWDGGDTIFWGTADTIFWGTVNAIFAGNADTIFWGTSDTIFWGTSDTIFWGTSDTIFWGTSDPIFWGATDTIFWGTADTTFGGAGDPIFWRTLGRNMIAEAETGAETMSPTRSN